LGNRHGRYGRGLDRLETTTTTTTTIPTAKAEAEGEAEACTVHISFHSICQ